MKDLDITFEQPAWESALSALRPGAKLSALHFLTLLEGEADEAVEDAFALLEEKEVSLDISTLPKSAGSNAAAARLRQEEQLACQGKLPLGLEKNDPLRLYLEEIARLPGDLREREALLRRCLAGDRQAQADLVNSYLDRVVQLAKALTGRGVLLLDLIQEGSLGLWQGILRYERGDFDAYVDWWIQAYLARAVILQARANGVGQKLRKAMEDYQAADKRLLTQFGRNPTLKEIALELHMVPQDTAIIEKMMRDARMVAKTKEPVKENDPEAEQAVENTAYFQSRQRILELLSVLDDTDAKILTLRFGLEGELPLSPQETGGKLGLTPDEVISREAAALQRLRGEE